MALSPKSPQEVAALLMEAYPVFSELNMPKSHAKRLQLLARDMRREVEALKPYTLSDEVLTKMLKAIRRRALNNGVWRADKGDGANERLAFAIERMSRLGYKDTEAIVEAQKELQSNGVNFALKEKRKDFDRMFLRSVTSFQKSNLSDLKENHKRLEKLRSLVFDMTNLNGKQQQTVSKLFSSGNFLYHGTSTEQIIEIMDSGFLANAKSLFLREDRAAKKEGRPSSSVRRNSGYEGISWSMNAIDALPGDRYHLAGFIAAPETVLRNNEQLVVPSRPAPYEVLQISSKINAKKYYDAKTQYELYRSQSMMGETNSVVDNLTAIRLWNDKTNRKFRDKPKLRQIKRELVKDPEYISRLRTMYEIDVVGVVHLSPDLLQQIDEEIPVAAVWLQAALDTGRLPKSKILRETLSEVIDALNDDAYMQLVLAECRLDWQQFETILNEAEKQVGKIEVSVEHMMLVVSRADVTYWLKLLACIKHMPAGILLYDHQKVRLENFATMHRGDQTQLTKQLQKVITPNRHGYIEYSKVLGQKYNEAMRTGRNLQVIGERYLTRRAVIKNVNGKLIVH